MYVCTRVYVSSVLLLKRLAILLPLSLGVIVCSRLNSSPSAVVGTSFEIRSNKKRLDYSILWLLLYSITVVYLLFGFHSMVDLLVPSRLVVYAKVIHANKLLSLPRIDDCHDRSERVSMKISAVLKTTYTNGNRMQQSLVRFFFFFIFPFIIDDDYFCSSTSFFLISFFRFAIFLVFQLILKSAMVFLWSQDQVQWRWRISTVPVPRTLRPQWSKGSLYCHRAFPKDE